MKFRVLGVTVLVIGALAFLGLRSSVDAQLQTNTFKASLVGFNEVPAVSTTGTGTFLARVDKDDNEVTYELSYSGLEGTTVSAAHIHLGQKDVNGGVSVFLCGGGSAPSCPLAGTVTGTFTAADVIGPVGQGIAPGELAELLRAMRDGVTYVNVHTNKHPGGEIRGQINR